MAKRKNPTPIEPGTTGASYPGVNMGGADLRQPGAMHPDLAAKRAQGSPAEQVARGEGGAWNQVAGSLGMQQPGQTPTEVAQSAQNDPHGPSGVPGGPWAQRLSHFAMGATGVDTEGSLGASARQNRQAHDEADSRFAHQAGPGTAPSDRVLSGLAATNTATGAFARGKLAWPTATPGQKAGMIGAGAMAGVKGLFKTNPRANPDTWRHDKSSPEGNKQIYGSSDLRGLYTAETSKKFQRPGGGSGSDYSPDERMALYGSGGGGMAAMGVSGDQNMMAAGTPTPGGAGGVSGPGGHPQDMLFQKNNAAPGAMWWQGGDSTHTLNTAGINTPPPSSLGAAPPQQS